MKIVPYSNSYPLSLFEQEDASPHVDDIFTRLEWSHSVMDGVQTLEQQQKCVCQHLARSTTRVQDQGEEGEENSGAQVRDTSH